MRPTHALATVALGLALSACGGGAAGGGPAAPAASVTDTANATAEIQTFRFTPQTLTVAAGSTVTWTNRDATVHTVTAGSAASPRPDAFDVRLDTAGDRATVTFDAPGTHAYHCVIHPFMVGTVEVTG